jgi:subtilisin
MSPSRRNVLETVTGSLVALGATGLASAAPDETVRVNVGYSVESGRQATLAAATNVVHEFTFDALTVRGEKQALTGLADRADIRYVESDDT